MASIEGTPAVKRGRGRPRTTDVRVSLGLDAATLTALEASAEARGLPREAEIRRRLLESLAADSG